MQSLTQDNLCYKNFTNERGWRNWRKFSPGEIFHVYGINSQYIADVLMLSQGEGHTDRFSNKFLR